MTKKHDDADVGLRFLVRMGQFMDSNDRATDQHLIDEMQGIITGLGARRMCYVLASIAVTDVKQLGRVPLAWWSALLAANDQNEMEKRDSQS